LSWNGRKAPDRLKATDATTRNASHSHADGRSRQARRTQKAMVVLKKARSSRHSSRLGKRLRAMTKPEIAKNRSTPVQKPKYA